jgi:hypothetical protein
MASLRDSRRVYPLLDLGAPVRRLAPARGQFCGSLNDIPPDLTKHLSAAQKEAVVTLSGPLSDDQLYALLAHFREFGLPLISVNKVEPDLEEVFMKLVEAV